ncbi:GWxTD domain-containing protein [bacterium]|nr:GWxTD domain-containing protein [bacterium]
MRIVFRSVLTFLLLFPALTGAQSQYDTWLKNEGYYLLTPQEKEKFRTMSDVQKELYLRNLWASLDTNPITPENEYQIEYMKRFEYAKRHYSIPSDRAKIYLLLGKPNSVETHPNSDKYFPLELWSYYSLGYPGLPPSLDLIFFKRYGAGDYRLYSPLFDGMKALTPSSINLDSPRMRAQIKAYFDPQIVEASEKMSTGSSPSESETIRMVLTDPAAIRRIEKKRPTVETTVVYEGLEADITTYSVPHRDGVFRTSIAVAIPPKYMSFEKNEAIYQGRVDMIGTVVDDRKNEIVRINDSPAIKMSESEFSKAQSYLFCYVFDAYLLPGKYTLNSLFRDYVSNSAGKLERTFEVKPQSGELELLPPLIAYKVSTAEPGDKPFQYGSQQFLPKENSALSDQQWLILYTKLLNPAGETIGGTWDLKFGLKREGENVLELSETLPLSETQQPDITRKIHLQSLVPGSYIAYMRLLKPGITIESESPLRISTTEEILGRLRIMPQSVNPPAAYHTNLALQYFLQNDLVGAARHARIAIDLDPASYAARGLLARIEKAKGNTESAITSYEKLLQESPGDSDGYYFIGKWSLEEKNAQKASLMLKKAMELGLYSTDLLNSLASAELQLGNPRGAVDYWEKSLALDSKQPEIEKLLSQHKQ